jgi:hypothetical protein
MYHTGTFILLAHICIYVFMYSQAVVITEEYDVQYCSSMLLSVAAQSKAWVCGRLLAEIACSNPTGGMDVCLI